MRRKYYKGYTIEAYAVSPPPFSGRHRWAAEGIISKDGPEIHHCRAGFLNRYGTKRDAEEAAISECQRWIDAEQKKESP
jgi:hypothetical protein